MRKILEQFWESQFLCTHPSLFKSIFVGCDGEGDVELRVPGEPLAGAGRVAAQVRVELLQDVGQREVLPP